MKKLCMLILCVAISACTTKRADPIPLYQPGDSTLDCHVLHDEIVRNQDGIMKFVPKTERMLTNTAFIASSAVLLVPIFFTDFSESQRITAQALQQRNNWLRTLGRRKHCKRLPPPIRFLPNKPWAKHEYHQRQHAKELNKGEHTDHK